MSIHAELGELRQAFDAMQPELELTARDPAMGVEGYVVVWNTGISTGGPLERCGKGGTRITPTLTLDEVKMLARTMALKNAAAGWCQVRPQAGSPGARIRKTVPPLRAPMRSGLA